MIRSVFDKSCLNYTSMVKDAVISGILYLNTLSYDIQKIVIRICCITRIFNE